MPPWKLSSDAVKMILPWPRATIAPPTARVSANCALRLTWSTNSQSASGVFGGRGAADRARVVDQDVHRAFAPGEVRAQSAYGLAGRRSRCGSPRRCGPAARTSFSTALPDSSSEALTPMMSAPAPASARAIARPMPRRAP